MSVGGVRPLDSHGLSLYEMRTKLLVNSEKSLERRFIQTKISTLSRTCGAILVLLVIFRFKVVSHITGGNFATFTPVAQGGDGNGMSNQTNDLKTILLWNTLFEDETFGLRQGYQ